MEFALSLSFLAWIAGRRERTAGSPVAVEHYCSLNAYYLTAIRSSHFTREETEAWLSCVTCGAHTQLVSCKAKFESNSPWTDREPRAA